MTPVGPVTQAERIGALDALRGFALLGILPANVLIFGMYYTASTDPTVAGGASGWNLASWAFFRILIEGRMRCLFSIVFGASAILLTARSEEAAGTTAAADIYYRRTLWLLVFGLAHAFLLFWGDILYPYAVCALVLFPFRRLPVRKLLAIGALFLAFEAGWNTVEAWRQSARRDLAAAGTAAGKAGRMPTADQAAAQKELLTQSRQRRPSPAELEHDARTWRGNPLQVIAARARFLAIWQALPYYDPANCDILSMMFIGMGLWKLGVLSAARSYRFYAGMAAAGGLAGLVLSVILAWLTFASRFDRVTMGFARIAYDVERLPVALAYTAGLMILWKAGRLRWLTGRLAAVGQTALSNYVLQSVICTFVFTGYGAGLYGRLERYQLYYVVALAWAVSLVASPLWLRRYRFGPLEWCWRSLTHWQRQPMRASPPPTATPAAAAVA